MAPMPPAFLKLFPGQERCGGRRPGESHRPHLRLRHRGARLGQGRVAHAKSPIWLVQYNHPHPYPPGVVITDMDVKTAGAYHNSDLPFWYGTLDSLNLFRHTRDWTPYDYKLSNQMQDVLVAFARTGNPNTAEVKIPRYDPKHEQRTGVRRQRHRRSRR